MEIKLSVIILTKNEENNIVDCIESVDFADEIVIVDDFSKDRTVDVVKNLRSATIKIFQHHLSNDFSSQRNFGLSKAKGEWVLFIDADERVSDALAFEISNIKYSPRGEADQISNICNGFYIKRRDVMWGKELKYGETGNIKLLRLAKKDRGVWEGKVHEVLRVKGRIEELRNPLMHYPHQDITQFLKEINFYTDIRAKELLDKNVKIYWWSIIAYSLGKFIFNYCIRRGFLDGLHGFVFAILMSFHSFLVRGKLWLLWQKK